MIKKEIASLFSRLNGFLVYATDFRIFSFHRAQILIQPVEGFLDPIV